MTYDTKLEKGRNGWRAATQIILPDVQAHGARPDSFGVSKAGDSRLDLTTRKDSHGGISSIADVSFYGVDGFTVHAVGFGSPSGDYWRTVLKSGDRCTEKAVARLHAEALARLPEIRAEISLHYLAKARA